MRAVKFHASPELLADALHMPPDTAFIAARVGLEYGRVVIEFVVTSESAEFPEVPEGYEPPTVSPTITRVPTGEFVWDWCIK